MLARKKLLIAGTGALLMVGLVAGAVFAQTPAPSTQPNQTQTGYGQYFLDRLAAALNVSRDQLNAAGQKAAGETIDKEQQDGKLTADQANQLKQKLTQNGGFPNGFELGRGGLAMPRAAGWQISAETYQTGVAQALGLSVADLQAQLKAGKTVADLAKAGNVAADKVKSAVVTVANGKLDQQVKDGKMTAQQATDIKNQLNQIPADSFLNLNTLNRHGGPMSVAPGGMMMPGGMMPGFALSFGGTQGPAFDAIAKTLGETSDQLRADLKSGKKLTDLASAKGVTADQIKAAVVAAESAQIDQAVTAGKLTADQAKQIKDKLNSMPADQFLQGRFGMLRILPGPTRGNNGQKSATPAPTGPTT